MNYCAYTYLKEDSNQCDYEIMTDRLASLLGLAMHAIKHIDRDELTFICEAIYHANGSIRGKNAIDDERFKKMEAIYAKYQRPFDKFYLPLGCEGASYLHVLRSECKHIVRLIVLIEKEKTVDKRIFDLFNLLSNLFFYMALYENEQEQFTEKEFVSLSYDIK
ncbi:MAG: ATP:cob(I)alamin adenosyltransferase [Erysipelotrichaceae bacterium]|nr:ATP:cob(I)alamin adenosyltransferase [Erysipelotrichaceae bacterium]MDY5251409.1 ATP:cob(I)alamin adenosyltransferase [Erysipelotrichaceae bacterium]